jgi:peptidoglycan/xylan/chitin deacetylase (PgdA/CDA1 family)
VGAWRLLKEFKNFNLPVAIALNTSIYDYCPELLNEFRLRGDEIVAHGHTNSEKQADMNEKQESKLIKNVTDMIKMHEGHSPKGWLSPWLSNNHQTVDLLQEAGYEYVLDWFHDNQPVWLDTRKGKILSMPFQEMNDIPAILIHNATAKEFADMLIDEFDELLEQSEDQPLVYSVSLHSFIVGQPFRIRSLRKALQHISEKRDMVWLTRPGDIAEHYKKVSSI